MPVISRRERLRRSLDLPEGLCVMSKESAARSEVIPPLTILPLGPRTSIAGCLNAASGVTVALAGLELCIQVSANGRCLRIPFRANAKHLSGCWLMLAFSWRMVSYLV
jgi:hypothetical protein